MPMPPDLIGKLYGRLAVIANAEPRNGRRFLCRCVCGIEKIVAFTHLQSGTKSCGCLRREQTAARVNLDQSKHGLEGTSEYRAWSNARQRCGNPKHQLYKNYGARGISVCKEWSTFEQFLADMGPKPTPAHSLDRHPDNDGPYAPSNCRWATRSEQQQNKRPYPKRRPRDSVSSEADKPPGCGLTSN